MKHKKLKKRIISLLLVTAMIITTEFTNLSVTKAETTSTETKANTESTQTEPNLSETNYRYMLVGTTYKFNLLNDERGNSYTWSSSNNKIVTVDKNGNVKAKKAGKATITCEVKTKQGKYQLKAYVNVIKSIKRKAQTTSIYNKTQSILLGEKYQLRKTVSPSNSKDYFNWTSSDSSVATVDKNGRVEGCNVGEATITVTSLSGKAMDRVKLTVTADTSVQSQDKLEKALQTKLVKSITINTDEDMEFTIPEGSYAEKKLIINAPKSTVHNYGVFKEIEVLAIKTNTFYDYVKGNLIHINALNARIVIEKDSSPTVFLDKKNSMIRLNVKGQLALVVNASAEAEITGTSGIIPDVTVNSEGSIIRTGLALHMTAFKKAVLELITPEAEKTTVKVSSKEVIPTIKGIGNIPVDVNGMIQLVSDLGGGNASSSGVFVNPTPTNKPTVAPTPTTAPTKPDKVTATFGTPKLDGVIDDNWKKAAVIVPVNYSKTSDVTVKHRLMWDDNALYCLSEVKDSNLDKANSASYQHDSLELFLDEKYDKATSYKSDDVHYRVNYDNQRTTDSGDSLRFNSKTQITKDDKGNVNGYIVEACIAFDTLKNSPELKNGKEMGVELQINECSSGKRNATINVFDTTDNAWSNPSLFGKLVLVGKETSSITPPNPTVLLNYIDTVKNMNMDNYVNADIIKAPLAEAEKIAASTIATQKEIDNAYTVLKTAVGKLSDGSGMPAFSSLDTISLLPDPFEFKIGDKKGSRISSVSEWPERRAEISKLAQYYEFGVKPKKPDIVTGVFSDNSINVTCTNKGKTISFKCNIQYPTTGKAPYPAMIGVNMNTLNTSEILNLGVALITFPADEIGAEADASSRGKGKFFDLYGSNYDAGALMTWAWGVDRLIDALETTPTAKIDPTKLGVTGGSRNGKGALVIGAFDERIALTIPQESGGGGASGWRTADAMMASGVKVQTLDEIIGENCWYAKSLNQFNGNTTKLPFDHHEIMALCAPRGLLVIENPIDWLGVKSCFDTSSAGHMVYDALGVPDNMGYSSVAQHAHCSLPASQQPEITSYIQKFLLGQDSNTKVWIESKEYMWDPIRWCDWDAKGLDITDSSYIERFNNNAGLVKGSSGAVVSVNDLGLNKALKVDTGDNNGFATIPIVVVASGPAVVSAQTIKTVSGSAIVVSGSAINISTGSAISISVSLMYTENVTKPVEFEFGIITNTPEGQAVKPISVVPEATAGKYMGNWRVLTATYIPSGNDTYLYFKVKNTSTYYVDNIQLK